MQFLDCVDKRLLRRLFAGYELLAHRRIIPERSDLEGFANDFTTPLEIRPVRTPEKLN